ncbi:hypothetical protein B2J93_7600 [Marssonina coronariae]|uniref:Uncharacterized protein n=1 Tax=Diplocarpon coronariae TaxID=2795749 RepID=A0A218Z739_9HELO|nr:hypothetical protein B2J93_7600 [Marssonina coronariae]
MFPRAKISRILLPPPSPATQAQQAHSHPLSDPNNTTSEQTACSTNPTPARPPSKGSSLKESEPLHKPSVLGKPNNSSSPSSSYLSSFVDDARRPPQELYPPQPGRAGAGQDRIVRYLPYLTSQQQWNAIDMVQE